MFSLCSLFGSCAALPASAILTGMSTQTVAVLGAGAWGCALAHLLAGKGHEVRLWDRNAETVAGILATGENVRALPGLDLGEGVTPTGSVAQALSGSDWVIVAVASDGVREVAAACAPFLESRMLVLSASKGLDVETGLTMSECLVSVFADAAYAGLAVLSGPNLARELVRGVPSASVVASDNPPVARAAQHLLMTDSTFRVYTHTDVKGVELGGALKNVLAIGAGLSDGLGFGDNTKAALMTRGLAEMTQLGVAAGGQAVTFLGLSGVGDLLATSGSRLSRNYRVGLGLASGQTLKTVLRGLGQAAEGVPTAKAAGILSRRYGVETPVLASLASVLFDGVPPAHAVDALMRRAAREEFGF